MSTIDLSSFNLDTEIKKCSIIKPYEALKSDFAKKLMMHLGSKNEYNKLYISPIFQKILNEKQCLTPEEGQDFLNFINDNNELFYRTIIKYKWQFPARIQDEQSAKNLIDAMDMKREDHVLYHDGNYIWLDKIKNYVKSRINGQRISELHDSMSRTLYKSIQQFAMKQSSYALQWEMFAKLKGINYSERENKIGITIHNLNGIIFSSMDTEQTPLGTFKIGQLNDNSHDYTHGRSLENLKRNAKFNKLLKKSDAQAFDSLDGSNSFHFQLLQAVADQLWLNVIINATFIDNPENDKITNTISAWLYTLTRKEFSIPYKIDEKGLVSSIECLNSEKPVIYRNDDDSQSDFSFFLKV